MTDTTITAPATPVLDAIAAEQESLARHAAEVRDEEARRAWDERRAAKAEIEARRAADKATRAAAASRIEAATDALLDAARVYLGASVPEDRQHLAGRLQSFLAARLVPVSGVIPQWPHGPDASL